MKVELKRSVNAMKKLNRQYKIFVRLLQTLSLVVQQQEENKDSKERGILYFGVIKVSRQIYFKFNISPHFGSFNV